MSARYCPLIMLIKVSLPTPFGPSATRELVLVDAEVETIEDRVARDSRGQAADFEESFGHAASAPPAAQIS